MSNTTDNLARQRISGLLDDKSFMEIGSLVAARSTDFNLKQVDAPSDGVVTGYGLIAGNLVYVYSQDADVLNGTIGEMHSKKIAAIYDMAMKMGAPIIGFIDCAGIRLQESVDALHGFGEIYSRQVAASGVIPQICAVFGTCGGGLSVVSALCDFAYIESKNGSVFVNSPNAIPGNTVEKCDTAGAEYQSKYSGNFDGTGSTQEILRAIRELVSILPDNNAKGGYQDECTDDLNRTCEGIAAIKGDARLVLSHISDDHTFIEAKADYDQSMVTGFIKLNGMTVGAVAPCTQIHNADGEEIEHFEPVLNVRGCNKAADFVQFCDAFDIPVITLTNIEGFDSSMCSEKGLAHALARLTYAFANATVPKVNIITGNAYGSAYVIFNSKALGTDLTYAWKDSKIGMMDAKLAAKIMYAEEDAQVVAQKAKEYDALQSNVIAAAKRGYVDLIIEPADTRKYAIAAFEMLYTKRLEGPIKKHGTK
ncbi:carboxyl transferase [Lachnospiraceae bacterium ZAX-1]